MAKPKKRWMPLIPLVVVLGPLIRAGPRLFALAKWEHGVEVAALAAYWWVAEQAGGCRSRHCWEARKSCLLSWPGSTAPPCHGLQVFGG